MTSARSPGHAEFTFELVAAVDKAIREHGWSMATCDRIAKERGVSRPTVYRAKRLGERWTRDHIRPADIEKFRLEQIIACTDIRISALAAGNHAAAVKAVETQAKIIGTIAPQNVNVNVSGGVSLSPAVITAVLSLDEGERRRLLSANTPPEALILEGECVPVGDGAVDGGDGG